jgi:hypothetical protein
VAAESPTPLWVDMAAHFIIVDVRFVEVEAISGACQF